jgi:hypothetical protein
MTSTHFFKSSVKLEDINSCIALKPRDCIHTNPQHAGALHAFCGAEINISIKHVKI